MWSYNRGDIFVSDGICVVRIFSPVLRMKYMPSPRDLAELIEVYNPFGFKTPDRVIMMFPTYEECYGELLDRLYLQFPRYVDLVLFCVDNLDMSNMDAVRFIKSWRSFCIDEQFMIDWKGGGTERDSQLEKVARGMHTLSGTKFNKDMFKMALEKFKIKNQILIA